MRFSLTVLLTLFALTSAPQDRPAAPTSRPGPNIALGATYTLDPPPNYALCTDPSDLKQLTDGVYSEGYFWAQPATVGWSAANPIVVTLDLGKVSAIRGVSFNTAAGVAGVEWPRAIYVFMADEDKRFFLVDDLVRLSAKNGAPPAEGYARHRYWTDALRTHGRYVALVFAAQPYAFVDEVEVYGGEPEWINTPHTGEPVTDIKLAVLRMAEREAIVKRVENDIAVLRGKLKAPETPKPAQDAVAAELDAIEKALIDVPLEIPENFRAVLPLNPLHARMFHAQAKLWQAKGIPPLTAWQSGLWDPLSHMADPPRDAKPHVEIRMMSNEYRAGAFNVTAAGDDTVSCQVRITGMPGGPNPNYITVHEAAWTDTKNGTPVAAALPEAPRKDDAYLVTISPGMTRQVWLTFHPTDVAPGVHEGRIELAAGSWRAEIPLTLNVYPLRFPDKPRLHFGGWDYTDVGQMYGVTPENKAQLVAHLRAHYVDSPWGTSAVLPHGKYDEAGNLKEPPDTKAFDAWLDLWPSAAQYCVFAAVTDRFETWPMNTPAFEIAVKTWIAFWAKHAQEKGLKPEQLALLLVDEPSLPEQDATIVAWAKTIRAANTGVHIWEDPVHHDITKANPDLVPACHAVCPNLSIFVKANQDYRDYFAKQRAAGVTLEFYSCSGPARLLDPYTYHRLQAWACQQYGAAATYFWAFGDTGGGSSWNEAAAKGTGYTPLFLDATTVTAGKHLEACREGIEDFEYLAMLHDAVAAAEAKGKNVETARRLLAELPARVCAAYTANPGFRWHKEMDRTVADAARVEVLDALVALQKP